MSGYGEGGYGEGGYGGNGGGGGGSVSTISRSAPTGKILGCGTPSVYVTNVGGGKRLAELAITSLNWKRALDEMSECRVTLAAGQDAKCIALLNDLEPFLHEITAYRDATEAWVGPVTEPSFSPTDATILARDLFQWFERRVEPLDRNFIDTDLSTIAAQLMVDGLAIDPSPNISFTVNPCGVLGTRQYIGITYRRVADEVREMSRGGLDFTCIGRRILFGGKEIGVSRLPTLTEEYFEIPNYRKAGLQKANHVFVFGAVPDGVTTPLVGEAGGLDTPVVEMTVQEPSIRDIPSATAAAETRWDLWHRAPEFITGRFLEDAPVEINDLVPGAIAEIRQQVGFKYVVGDFRLVGVEADYQVSDSGMKETISGVFQPLGTTETG